MGMAKPTVVIHNFSLRQAKLQSCHEPLVSDFLPSSPSDALGSNDAKLIPVKIPHTKPQETGI